MQEAIRYYITKRGDEPTVRSVKVALGAEADEQVREDATTADAARQANDAPSRRSRKDVGRLVKKAVRKRTATP